MARSKNGGTRAYIRGRIGSDVYSVGKNSKGEKQQVVRSLAETVANPRSSAQMAGRMIMSTVMQAVHWLQPIIDHSFDGLPVGQPSISEFIRRNYALLKAGDGQYNAYQEKGIKNNAFIVSNGNAVAPAALTFFQNEDDDSTMYGLYSWFATVKKEVITMADIRTAINPSGEEFFITLVQPTEHRIIRFALNPDLAGETVITDDNISNVIKEEILLGDRLSTCDIQGEGANHRAIIGFGAIANRNTAAWIISVKKNGVWTHSATSLWLPTPKPATNWDTALATYPVGSEQFLNGGNI